MTFNEFIYGLNLLNKNLKPNERIQIDVIPIENVSGNDNWDNDSTSYA